MAHYRNMGIRRQGNTTPQKTTNLIEDSMENEENEDIVADSSRMVISMFNEPSEVHKEMLKEELKRSS
jgi:hypothetical protein